ncbi:hypothetical protein GCM10022399_18680 [Terrabacter ginsenosidimutans]|uniref:Cupin domain-containing protein n=2 Tax=Terrabacter ginsenosidimutans TaxID=490575 RepID=A0ABP7DD12_9MICO
MVDVGDVIENPVTGERITFVRTSEQTGGALAELDLELSPTAFLAAEHIHRSQEEKFQVLEGRILLRCRGEESMCGPGETVVVPRDGLHANLVDPRRGCSRPSPSSEPPPTDGWASLFSTPRSSPG